MGNADTNTEGEVFSKDKRFCIRVKILFTQDYIVYADSGKQAKERFFKGDSMKGNSITDYTETEILSIEEF